MSCIPSDEVAGQQKNNLGSLQIENKELLSRLASLHRKSKIRNSECVVPLWLCDKKTITRLSQKWKLAIFCRVTGLVMYTYLESFW